MRFAIAVLAVLTLSMAACNKKKPDDAKQADEAAKANDTGEKDETKESAEAAPKAAATFGANAGDELAKLDFSRVDQPIGGSKGAPGAAGDPETAKIRDQLLGKIPEAKVEPVAPVKSFGGVSTSSGFRVVYNPSDNEIHDGLRDALQSNRVFETLTEALNKLVRLPDPIDVQLVDCGQINAFYDPNNKRIIVCYELMTYFAGMFKDKVKTQEELGIAVIGATTFAFFHEVGHGLIHVLDLPAVGREEDSADQLATLILIGDGDDGVGMALQGAHWFKLQQDAGNNKTPFYDEHAFDGQRFYNIMCMVYGSDSGKYGEIATSGMLPEARAARCPEEYRKISKSWEKLLQPHLTNTAAKEIDYAPPVDPTETNSKTDDAPPAVDDPDPDPAPAEHAITCEQVAVKALELIQAEAIKQAANMTEEQVEELKAKLESELPAFVEQLLAQCAKEDWPDKDRQCVLKASSLEKAAKCGIN
jgi:hypothetical protein